MERKVIDVGHLNSNVSEAYLYMAALDADEIIFSVNRPVTVVEIDGSEDLQFKCVISKPSFRERIHSIIFPLPVIKLALDFNGDVVIDLTSSKQPTKIITFQSPVDVIREVQITIKFQLDPSVFQGGLVKFDTETGKICTPNIRFGLLTDSDVRESLDIFDQVKTYKLE